MRFSAAAFLALVSAVFAQTEGFNVIASPDEGDAVPAGETWEILWTPDAAYGDKPVSIILIGGPSQPKQQVLETLAEDIPSSAGSFTWEVDESLGDQKVYGIKIQLQEDPEIFQYSFPFSITPDEDHGDHSSSAPATSAPSSTVSPTKTKSQTSKPTDYPTASVSSESSTFSSVYVPSSGVPSTITSAASSEPTGTATGTATSTSTTTIATGAANVFGANGFAVLGGFAMAALAL
ncbi:Ser-Thr-rich glycosyl-phosphatidyl-inositol-anchored membrane family domain containing protein [Naviculisporaceae sp. PSN 640]